MRDALSAWLTMDAAPLRAFYSDTMKAVTTMPSFAHRRPSGCQILRVRHSNPPLVFSRANLEQLSFIINILYRALYHSVDISVTSCGGRRACNVCAHDDGISLTQASYATYCVCVRTCKPCAALPSQGQQAASATGTRVPTCRSCIAKK